MKGVRYCNNIHIPVTSLFTFIYINYFSFLSYLNSTLNTLLFFVNYAGTFNSNWNCLLYLFLMHVFYAQLQIPAHIFFDNLKRFCNFYIQKSILLLNILV